MNIEAAVQILVATSTLVLSAAVLYYTRKTVALESLRATRNSWMQVDQVALSDDKNLIFADQLFHPDAAANTDEARRRWIAYMALNPVVSEYIAVRENLTAHPRETMEGCRAILKTLLRNEDVFAMTQSGAYIAPFAALCREVRESL